MNEHFRSDELLECTDLVARLLGVKPRTLEGWRRRGCGPPFIRLSGRVIRYNRADLERWLNERRVDDDTVSQDLAVTEPEMSRQSV